MAGYDLSTNRLYGHITKRKGRTAFLAFCRYLRSLHPPEVRIAIVLDKLSPHRLAEPARSHPPAATRNRHQGRNHQEGEGCLTRH